jgi:hypothetical protein
MELDDKMNVGDMIEALPNLPSGIVLPLGMLHFD